MLSVDNTSVLAYTRTMGDSEVLVVLNMGTSASAATVEGITAGDWSLWLNSETIAQGTSRKQETLDATHTFALDAKGYRVYVRGIFPEQDDHTAIQSIRSTDDIGADGWFDLRGNRLDAPRKGLNIHNGRKYWVK